MNGFHARDGWFFRRLEEPQNPGVQIVVGIPDKIEVREDGSMLFGLSLSHEEWASIVASVSKGGEEKGRFYTALRFHESEDAEPGYE